MLQEQVIKSRTYAKEANEDQEIIIQAALEEDNSSDTHNINPPPLPNP